MIEKSISHFFIDSVKKRFMELGFPSSTSGQLSRIISPCKIDIVAKKVSSRCDNFFYLEQIIKPYHEEIHDIVRKCWGDGFVFEIDNSLDKSNINSLSELITNPPSEEKIQQSKTNQNIKFQKKHNENENLQDFTFENFILYQNNQDAIKACNYIVSKKSKFFAPLFVCAHTGLGKTHLLQATANKYKQENSDARVVFVSCHNFVNEVVHKGIRQGKIEEVRNKYNACDLSLVDDFEVLEKKAVCQDEFLNILSALLNNKKSVIIASNKPPKDFKFISDKLKSRVSHGAIVEIKAPTQQERIKLLKIKSEAKKIQLSSSQIEIIATALQTNVRELEGVLNDIEFQSNLKDNKKFQNHEITNELYKRFSNNYKNKISDLKNLLDVICKRFDVNLADLKSEKRDPKLTIARHITIYFAKKYLMSKNSCIIQTFNRKHHKIIFYSVKKISSLLNENLEINAHIDLLKQELL